MERQQIRVASHYDIGSAMHGNLQKLVVSGIAASADGKVYLNLLANIRKFRHKPLPHAALDIAIKAGSPQHFYQFKQS
jgi:H+/Cl- antiporter ClcA